MSTSIATVYEYSRIMNVVLSDADKTRTAEMLAISTDVVQRFCDREFASQTRNEWINRNEPRTLAWVSQYPVTRVVRCATARHAGWLRSTATLASATIMPDSTNVLMASWYDAGVEETLTVALADAATLDDLATTLNDDSASVWTAEIDSGMETMPCSLLKPVPASDGSGVELLLPGDAVHVIAVLEDELELNSAVTDLFARYTAGYTVSVDASDHNSLVTTGNVPSDLLIAVCYVARDLMSWADSTAQNESMSGLIKSETIGNYSYDLFDTATMDRIVLNYETVLTKHCRRVFAG